MHKQTEAPLPEQCLPKKKQTIDMYSVYCQLNDYLIDYIM